LPNKFAPNYRKVNKDLFLLTVWLHSATILSVGALKLSSISLNLLDDML